MQSFFVSGCFHWIGFHIVNHLLEQGCSVTGYECPLTEKQEHLEMMIGRNDLFSLSSDDPPAGRYTYAILLGEALDATPNMKAEKTCQLSREKVQGGKGMVAVRIPLLFGEWMPMNEDGIYVEEQFIPFNSETFQNEAVYINDFIASLMLCIMSSRLPETLIIKPRSRMAPEKGNDRQVIYLRERKPIEKQIQTVVEHYKRFKDLYSME